MKKVLRIISKKLKYPEKVRLTEGLPYRSTPKHDDNDGWTRLPMEKLP
jgi:hypothetical protein